MGSEKKLNSSPKQVHQRYESVEAVMAYIEATLKMKGATDADKIELIQRYVNDYKQFRNGGEG